MSSSLLHQTCQHVLFVFLCEMVGKWPYMVCEMVGKWPYICCSVGYCFHDLFKKAHSIHMQFFKLFVKLQVVQLYSSTDTLIRMFDNHNQNQKKKERKKRKMCIMIYFQYLNKNLVKYFQENVNSCMVQQETQQAWNSSSNQCELPAENRKNPLTTTRTVQPTMNTETNFLCVAVLSFLTAADQYTDMNLNAPKRFLKDTHAHTQTNT